MNTHSNFDINSITRVGNKAIVTYTLSEGFFETLIVDEVEQTVFNRADILKISEVVFNYFPVPDLDITNCLKQITKQYSSLPLCF